MRPYPWLIALSLIMAAVNAAPALSGEAPSPSRIGRLSVAETGSGLRPAGGAWADAVVNEPVAAGSSLRTGGTGRAVFRLGGAAVALAPGSAIDILRCDEQVLQIALVRGRIGLRLGGSGTPEAVEIDTARGGVWPSAPGQYDVDATGAGGALRVAAFAGEAKIAGGGASGTVAEGQQALVTDKADKIATGAAIADPFSGWWQDETTRAASLDRVPPDMTGAAALAADGHWQDTSDFGPVWMPNDLPAGWVPFRDGSWRFLPPWGWTWIGKEDWSFAPSHYGRWVLADHRWGWVPPKHGEPVYAPATVAFLGTPGIGISYAGGSGPAVAWFPLGPDEPYWAPDAGTPPASVIDATYRYREYATAVPRAVFVAGKPVADALVDIPKRRLVVAPLVAGGPQIPPAAAPRPPTIARPVAAAVQPVTVPQPVVVAHSGAAAPLAVVHRSAKSSKRAVVAARRERHLVHLAAEHRRESRPAHPATTKPPAPRAAANRGRHGRMRLAEHHAAAPVRVIHLGARAPHPTRVATTKPHASHPRRQHLAAAHHILRQ